MISLSMNSYLSNLSQEVAPTKNCGLRILDLSLPKTLSVNSFHFNGTKRIGLNGRRNQFYGDVFFGRGLVNLNEC